MRVLFQINVDDSPFGIGPNLKAALQSIRHLVEPKYLWVDAICINQKDIAERNYQVSIMRWIYQKAVQVIIWLGKKSFDSDHAMDVLESDDLDGANATTYVAKGLATWKALSCFFARTYWSRVWVMQEAVWAVDVIIMCGTRKMSWDSLLGGSIYVRATLNATNPTLTTGTLMRFIQSTFVTQMMEIRAKKISSMNMESERIDSSPLSLRHLLSRVRLRESSDPRDKVFAILNILPSDEWPCAPDYSKDAAQVFTEVAKYVIEKSRRLDLLGTCEHPWLTKGQNEGLRETSRYTEVAALPSWTPNWATKRVSVPLQGGYDHVPFSPLDSTDTGRCFAASGESVAEFIFSEDMTTLCVRGFQIDIVTASSISPVATTLNDVRQPRLYNKLEQVTFRERPRNSIYAGRISRLEAFFRALVLGDQPDGTSFDPGTVTQYLQWKNGSRDEFPDLLRSEQVKAACLFRHFLCSSKGYMGFGPNGTTAGDLMCVMYGCHVPIVLRKRPAYYLAGGGTCHEHENFRNCLLSACSNRITFWKEIEEHYIVIGEACKYIFLFPYLYF